MYTRTVTAIVLLAFWIFWSPFALASHMAAGGRPMCAMASSEVHDAGTPHPSGHDANTMHETAGKLCSLGLCMLFPSPGESLQFRDSYAAYAPRPSQNPVMALPQIPDPVPKSLLFQA